MSISIDPKIKPLWKSLRDLGMEKYLISSRFEELCKDINIEGLWNQYIQHAEDEDFIIPMESEEHYATEALAVLLEVLIKRGKEEFIDIVSAIIADFKAFCPITKDFSPIKKNIVDLGYETKETLWIFSEYKKKFTNIDVQVTHDGLIYAGQHFDAFCYVTDILSQARQTIVIIDAYSDFITLLFLPRKKPQIEVKILTKKVSERFKAYAEGSKERYKKLCIRTSGAFHDRFVIIDDTSFYHFGASIDEHLGKRLTMFSRIDEPRFKIELREWFESEWRKAEIIIGD